MVPLVAMRKDGPRCLMGASGSFLQCDKSSHRVVIFNPLQIVMTAYIDPCYISNLRQADSLGIAVENADRSDRNEMRIIMILIYPHSIAIIGVGQLWLKQPALACIHEQALHSAGRPPCANMGYSESPNG